MFPVTWILTPFQKLKISINWVRHEDLFNENTMLIFEMGSTPNLMGGAQYPSL